jgi:DNA-binding transcriptional ArsR family regulator
MNHGPLESLGTPVVEADGQAPDDPFSTLAGLRLDEAELPTRKVETPAHRRRRRQRGKFFVPASQWLEVAAALSRVSTSRAALLWHLLRMQSKIEEEGWLVPRLSFLVEAGLGDRKARSRAVVELEQAGLVEVRRRSGKLPLLRLVEPTEHGGENDG